MIHRILLLITIIMTCTVTACTPSSTVTLNRQFESNAFTFHYPDGWRHQIPQPNILFLASPEVLAQQSGATVAIQRSIPLSSGADTLEDALTIYLERGPLRSDRAWAIVEEAQSTQLDTYEALKLVVEGSESAGTLPMRSEIYILLADSGFFFIVTLTAPQEQWDDVSPIFVAIIDSIDILE